MRYFLAFVEKSYFLSVGVVSSERHLSSENIFFIVRRKRRVINLLFPRSSSLSMALLSAVLLAF